MIYVTGKYMLTSKSWETMDLLSLSRLAAVSANEDDYSMRTRKAWLSRTAV